MPNHGVSETHELFSLLRIKCDKNKCISCGKCVNVCPLNNIHMENGKPVWNNECTHCMACICRCPKEAIEYGEHSKGLPRYICKKY